MVKGNRIIFTVFLPAANSFCCYLMPEIGCFFWNNFIIRTESQKIIFVVLNKIPGKLGNASGFLLQKTKEET